MNLTCRRDLHHVSINFNARKAAVAHYLPASLRTRRFVQCLTHIANGRTRSSTSTYVRIIRVFSSARVLLTFISQANRSSGSQILTIGTFAWDTQTTRSIPSIQVSHCTASSMSMGLLRSANTAASRHTCSKSLKLVVIQISTAQISMGSFQLRVRHLPSESLEQSLFPDEPKIFALIS